MDKGRYVLISRTTPYFHELLWFLFLTFVSEGYPRLRLLIGSKKLRFLVFNMPFHDAPPILPFNITLPVMLETTYNTKLNNMSYYSISLSKFFSTDSTSSREKFFDSPVDTAKSINVNFISISP